MKHDLGKSSKLLKFLLVRQRTRRFFCFFVRRIVRRILLANRSSSIRWEQNIVELQKHPGLHITIWVWNYITHTHTKRIIHKIKYRHNVNVQYQRDNKNDASWNSWTTTNSLPLGFCVCVFSVSFWFIIVLFLFTHFVCIFVLFWCFECIASTI